MSAEPLILRLRIPLHKCLYNLPALISLVGMVIYNYTLFSNPRNTAHGVLPDLH